MNCKEYKNFYLEYTNYPIPKEVFDTPHYREWLEHRSCEVCSDWEMGQEVISRGDSIDNYPCVHMAYWATFKCQKHDDLYHCSDAEIVYEKIFDEYSINAKGGNGDLTVIKFCPFCGTKLPHPKRDLYYEELESKGIDWIESPESIPKDYQSDAWYKT